VNQAAYHAAQGVGSTAERTAAGVGIGIGVGIGVRVGIRICVCVRVRICVGVGVRVCVGIGVDVGIRVAVGGADAASGIDVGARPEREEHRNGDEAFHETSMTWSADRFQCVP